MAKKLIFLLLCFSTKIACMGENLDNNHHEKRVLSALVGILKRKSLPEEDFRTWCQESSRVLSASEKDSFKRLGSTLEDIHAKTSSLTSAAALLPTVISTVTTFVEAVKHHEPEFNFNWWEHAFVASHVTPWALKDMYQSSKGTK